MLCPLAIDYPGPLVQSGPQISIFTATWSSPQVQSSPQISGYLDDFLVALRELANTCNYCSDQCSQKNIRDQTIEGMPDGDTIEQLLKQSDLTLEAAITICRAQEAAKKQRREMCDNIPGAILAVRQQRRQPPTTQRPVQGVDPNRT